MEPEKSTEPPAPGRLLAWLCLVLGALAAALVLTRTILLGLLGEWVWPYVPAFHLTGAVVPAIGLFAIYSLIAFLLWKKREAKRWLPLLLVALVIVAWLGQIALNAACGRGLVFLGACVASPVSTTYYSEASKVEGVLDYIRTYPDLMPSMDQHAATHPPGAVLVYWALKGFAYNLAVSFGSLSQDWLAAHSDEVLLWRAMVKRGAGADLTEMQLLGAGLVAWLIGLLGMLGLIPAFLLARRLAGLEAAVVTALCYPLVPGQMLFLPALDLLFPPLVFTLGWLLLKSLEPRQRWLAVLAGLLLAGGVFINFGLLALLPLFGLFAWLLGRSLKEAPNSRKVLLGATCFAAAGFAVPMLVWARLTDFPLMWSQAMAAHHALTATRTYSFWLGLNLLDVAIFLGLAAWPLLASGLARWPRNQSLLTLFTLSVCSILLLVDLSGSVLGEVARIWLFFYMALLPFVAWLALERLGPRWGLLPAGLALQAVAMVCSLQVIMPF